MKKVMLIGDSIRMGYQETLKNELTGEFDVWWPVENCRFAKYTLNELGRIFINFSQSDDINKSEFVSPTAKSKGELVKPDIVYWNNGLWDTSIVYEEDGPFTPVDEYLCYMMKILRELRKVTNKIIFATTTPVKMPNPNQKNEIIEEYNSKITELMKSEKVVISDLHKVVSSDVDRFIASDNLHLSLEGIAACAKAAAECVRRI